MKFRIKIVIGVVILFFCLSCQNSNESEKTEKSEKTNKTLSERAPQQIVSLHRPFDFSLVLSGNFGELRSNHFHSGIDFKTQGEIRKPIHCAYDGYVSQVSVSGGGYGRALYITHPEIGLTTVYAHIDQYAPKIDSIVRTEQYRRETFEINLKFPPDRIKVTSGEIIALSGNSGHSFGPHLHMEVRHTETGDALDPLPYFKSYIVDDVAPRGHKLVLYPYARKGMVEKSFSPDYRTINSSEKIEFNAWGLVCPAIRANDYMTNTHNVYGVKYMTLKVDGVEVYKRIIDRFQFGATRAINTLVDYRDLMESDVWNMHTRIPESKPLGCMVESSLPNGAIDINTQRKYECEFVLADEYGNTTTIPFVINGVPSEITSEPMLGKLIRYNGEDTINCDKLNVCFFEGCLYEDMHVLVSTKNSNQENVSRYCSSVYTIGDIDNPIGRSYRVEFDINEEKSKSKKYVVVRVGKNGDVACRSLCKEGKVVAYVSRFGDYAVTTDEKAPSITPVNSQNWSSLGKITYRISDNLSGIKRYRGVIDGKWVMFEADTKNSIITYELDSKQIKKGLSHQVDIEVVDYCGNESKVTNNFEW